MPWLEPVSLGRPHAQPKPLSQDHCDRLTEAAKAGELWQHFFNHDSGCGHARLGARQDGMLRNHQIALNGTLRDTVVYSIIASEWPTVKAHLNYQLNERPR